jgi:hypothetical protein
VPEFVKSADGTSIAYDVVGTGPSLVITGGAFNTRKSPGDLIGLLASHLTGLHLGPPRARRQRQHPSMLH